MIVLTVVTGPPKNFMIITRSRYLNLSWSRPVINFPRFNGITITYRVYCNIGGFVYLVITNATGIQISGGILPGQQYTCNVSAVSNIGSNPTRVISGVTSEDGKVRVFCCTDQLFVSSIVVPVVVAVRSNVKVVRGSNAVIQFTIKVADPSVQVENISWNFMSSSGMSSTINNTSMTLLSADRLTLTIVKTQLNDTGAYTITVSNSAGNHSQTVYLDVLGKHQKFIICSS